MNIILLSGGSGRRLWPLSNDVRSKQFIKIFRRENGYESMLQRVYRQLKEVDETASVTIATSKTQVSAIRNQLGEQVDICVEPQRRDTFPAICLAAAFLKERYKLSKVVLDDELLDRMLMSEETQSKLREECSLNNQHFQVIKSKLKQKKFLVDGKINPRLIPNLKEDSNTFQLLLLFDLK